MAPLPRVEGERDPRSWVLDVATGTGLVARELASKNVRVVGLDQSAAMVAEVSRPVRRRGLEDRVRFTLGQAQALPFADGSLDAVTFTYLLRCVDDPAATVAELVRVLRPGAVMASLEFHVPPEPWARAGWFAYTRSAMPLVGWTVSNEWYRTGRFLARSITEFVERYPLPVQVRWWQEAGMRRVRTKLLSSGAAVVTWAVKSTPVLGEESEDLATPMGETADRPAFYALTPAGGATTGRCCTRRTPRGTCRTWSSGRASRRWSTWAGWSRRWWRSSSRWAWPPTRSTSSTDGRSERIPDGVLWTIAVVGLGGAIGLGIHGTVVISPWLWAFIGVGEFLVVAYNLELFGGAFHSDVWFALAWGAFPALTAYFAQTGTIRVDAILVAAGCAAISAAQRALDPRPATASDGDQRQRRARHDRGRPRAAGRLLAPPRAGGRAPLALRRRPADRGRAARRQDLAPGIVRCRSWEVRRGFDGLGTIGQIHVSVTDVDRSVAFYRDVLGIPFLFRVPGQPMAFFDCGGVRLYLGVPESEDFRSRGCSTSRSTTSTRRIARSPNAASRSATLRTWSIAPRTPSSTWRSSPTPTGTTSP